MSARRSNSARSCRASGSNVQVRPQTSRSQCGDGGTWGCPRVNCTVCSPCPKLPKCPLGVYVERVTSLKPLSQYVPSDAKFNGLTTYRENYFPKCGARSLSFKPAATFDPSDAKMDGLTTYRENYTPKGTTPYQKPPWAIAARFDPSEAKFAGVSTYRNDYVALRGELVKSMKPLSQFDPSDAPLDGKTTYRCAYIPFCPREYQYAKQPMIHKGSGGDFSCAPFAGISTYRGDYWCKPIIKVKSMKPTIRGAFSDAPFADRTTYRNDYNPFHFDCSCAPCVPANIYNQVYPAEMYCCEPDPPTGVEPQEMCPKGWVPPMRDCSDRPVGCCPACPDPVDSKTSLNKARACVGGGVCGDQQRMLEDMERTLACNAACGGAPPSPRGGSQRGESCGGSQRGGSQRGGSQRGASGGGSQAGEEAGSCGGNEEN